MPGSETPGPETAGPETAVPGAVVLGSVAPETPALATPAPARPGLGVATVGSLGMPLARDNGTEAICEEPAREDPPHPGPRAVS